MNYQADQFNILEARFERLRLDLDAARAAIANLQTQIAGIQQGSPVQVPSGGGAGIFEIPGGASIPSGGSVTANVYALIGGVSTLVASSATVWNPYDVATTNGFTLTLGTNSDGSFTVIGQSC